MKKKVITLLLIALTVVLASCGNKNPDPKEVWKQLLQEFTDHLAIESQQAGKESEYWIREKLSRPLTQEEVKKFNEAGGRLKEILDIQEFVIVESEKKESEFKKAGY